MNHHQEKEMKKKKKKIARVEGKSSKTRVEISDYDKVDSTTMIDRTKALKFTDLGVELPPLPPTQVISIRLPSWLLNQLKALGSETGVPYQALIKLLLAEGVDFKKSCLGLAADRSHCCPNPHCTSSLK